MSRGTSNMQPNMFQQLCTNQESYIFIDQMDSRDAVQKSERKKSRQMRARLEQKFNKIQKVNPASLPLTEYHNGSTTH